MTTTTTESPTRELAKSFAGRADDAGRLARAVLELEPALTAELARARRRISCLEEEGARLYEQAKTDRALADVLSAPESEYRVMLDEIREAFKRLKRLNETAGSICAWCREPFAAGAEVQGHLRTCDKSPLAQALARAAAWKRLAKQLRAGVLPRLTGWAPDRDGDHCRWIVGREEYADHVASVLRQGDAWYWVVYSDPDTSDVVADGKRATFGAAADAADAFAATLFDLSRAPAAEPDPIATCKGCGRPNFRCDCDESG